MIPGKNFHLQELQIPVAVEFILVGILDPLKHGVGLAPQAGGDDHPGEIVQDPGEKAVVDLVAEDLAIYFNFSFNIENIGDIDILDPVGEGRQIGQHLLVLRIHQGKKQGVDPFLNMLDLVHPVADDVVQIHQPFGIVRLDVHQGINAVVALGVVGIEIGHLAAGRKHGD